MHSAYCESRWSSNAEGQAGKIAVMGPGRQGLLRMYVVKFSSPIFQVISKNARATTRLL